METARKITVEIPQALLETLKPVLTGTFPF
jgi:hypothetical protein